MARTQELVVMGQALRQVFAKGSWGGEWHSGFAPQPGDIVVKEHWGSSSFANTDLDMLLKQHGIAKVIVIGLLGQHVHRNHRPIRDRARVPRHAGEGRDRGLQTWTGCTPRMS